MPPTQAATFSAFAKRLFVETYAAQNADNQTNFNAYLAQSFGTDIQRSELSDRSKVTMWATDDNGPAGYFQLVFDQPAPIDLNIDSVCELKRFYVDKPWQGTGLAYRQMEHAIEQARLRAFGLWLGVWSENAHAIRFYERAGLQRRGTVTFHLGDDPQQDDVYALTW
ncbi:MAG: GNAT family N-acetyltransferase [Pseudomonadota bacterium]